MAKNCYTSGYIVQSGPWIPTLKQGQTNYTFTPAELSELLNKAFGDGYEFAKNIYYVPETTVTSTNTLVIAKETEHGTH